jgi:hypothetical protein
VNRTACAVGRVRASRRAGGGTSPPRRKRPAGLMPGCALPANAPMPSSNPGASCASSAAALARRTARQSHPRTSDLRNRRMNKGPLHRRQLAAPRLRQPGLQGRRRRVAVACGQVETSQGPWPCRTLLATSRGRLPRTLRAVAWPTSRSTVSKPGSTAVMRLWHGAANQKVPPELGQWECLKLLSASPEGHLLDAIVA